ncbi:hypothetical protein BGX26_005775, partial [Mortierella sp. AD094]
MLICCQCRTAIELQYPKIRDHLQTYRQFVDDDDGLKEARLGELMKQLKEDMSRFEDDSDEMVTIEILRILVKQSMPDKYERVVPLFDSRKSNSNGLEWIRFEFEPTWNRIDLE